MDDRRARLLRTAFLAGAVTDAPALVPMLSPPMARLLWGFDASDGAYRCRGRTADRSSASSSRR